MAFVVVTSLLGIVDHQLLQPHPPLNNILDDAQVQIAKSLSDKLRFLQAILLEKKTVNPELAANIRDVAVEAEAEIESKLGSVYLAAHDNNGDSVSEALCGLHHTLEQVLDHIKSLEDQIQNQKEGNTKDEMIGYEDEFQKLKDMIVDQQSSEEREAISVTGMGGIGKTTLAKTVYEHPHIVSRFETRAWAIVSQEHQIKEIFIRLLHCIDPTASKLYSEDYGKLGEELRRRLLGKRYLLVIDDIWSCKAWDEMQNWFPNNKNGSRILITTREKKVAEYATSSSKYIHSPRFLNTKESWNLFVTKVFGGKNLCKPDLESIGKSIVKKCQGLPLTIIVIAGILVGLEDKSPQAWHDVFENMSSFDPDKKLVGMLSLSYNYLPSHLKACLIYLGVFPEDTEIPVNKVINLWVAEGFLKGEEGKSLEEVTESYLHDLINRNLVQVSKRSFDGKPKSFKLHDMLYDLCRKEAQRENLLSVEKQLQSGDAMSSTDCRWISCTSSSWPTSVKVHSVLYFGKDVHLAKCMMVLSGLKMLRVLDLSLIKCWYGLPSELEDMVHLRYLALSALGSIGNFQLIKLRNLQTLIVSSWRKGCRLQLPRDILELPWLRHVKVDKRSSLYLPKLVQENLQTLLWLKVIGQDPTTTDFTRVPKLKELWVLIDNELPPNAFESVVDLMLLEKLKFEMGSVRRFYFPTALPENLKKLTLSGTYLPWKDLDIIGRLKKLEVLKLKNFAFYGPKWELSDGVFPELKLFVIAHSNLKCWNADGDHFPKLECLILKFCWDLKELPTDGFAYTLRLIELDSCYPSLVKSAEKIKIDRDNYGNNALDIRDLGAKVGLPNNEYSEEEEEEEECGI